MMKKYFTALLIIFFACVLIFPAAVSAEWSFSFSYDSDGSTTSSSSGGWSSSNYASFGLPSGSIINIIGNLLLWLLAIFGLVGVAGFVISGIMYLLAAGDESMIEKAKSAMKWSIVGVVVGLMGVVIIKAVDLALQASSGF